MDLILYGPLITHSVLTVSVKTVGQSAGSSGAALWWVPDSVIEVEGTGALPAASVHAAEVKGTVALTAASPNSAGVQVSASGRGFKYFKRASE